jgi:hypothetical protein
VADVVRGEVHLDAFLTELPGRQAHDPSTVDDDIDLWNVVPCQDGVSGIPHGRLAGQVDLEDPAVHIRELLLKSLERFLELRGASTGDDELSWMLRRLEGVCKRLSC